jgi:hypothetical protein
MPRLGQDLDTYALSGNRTEAQRVLDQLTASAPTPDLLNGGGASDYVALGLWYPADRS